MSFTQQPDRGGASPNGPAFDWLSPGRFALLLGLILVVTFPGVVSGLSAFSYGDAAGFAYPVAFYHKQCFWRGEIPFWNPLNSCGIPFLAQWNTMTLYPLSLFYLLLPMPWSFGVFCVGHMYLAGMGMYFLAHRWTQNRLAAALAGLAFAFNGVTWFGVMWPHILSGLAWMPWVVLAMESAWERGGKFIFIGALAAGMQLLSGGAEAIMQTWVIVPVLFAVRFCQTKESRPALAGRAVVAGLLGAGLAMIQLLPFFQLLDSSQRTAGFAESSLGKIAALPLGGWANYLVPLFHCSPSFNGVYMQAGQSWLGSYFLGVSVVAFALMALWGAQNARMWSLFGLALFGFVMALGSAGILDSVVIEIFPFLGFMRFPVKFLMLPTFALPLMAGLGLDWLLRLDANQWQQEWKLVKGLGIFLAVVIAGIVIVGKSHVLIANGAGRCLFLFGAIAVLPLLRKSGPAKIQRFTQISLLILAWADVLTHAPDLAPTAPSSSWRPNQVRQLFGWENGLRAGTSRALRARETFWQMLDSGLPDPALDLQGRRLSLFMNLNLLGQVPKFDGFYALDVKEHLDIFKHVYFTPNAGPALFDFLGISEIGNPTNVLAWNHRNTFMPLVTAGEKPALLDGPETINMMFSPAFQPRRDVYLPLDTKTGVTGAVRATVTDCQFHDGRIEFNIDAEGPAMVVIAQTYYPDWRASVDNVSVPLWRADYAFQALECPAGRRHVSLVYHHGLFNLGAAISAASALLCAAGWWWFRKARPPVPVISANQL